MFIAVTDKSSKRGASVNCMYVMHHYRGAIVADHQAKRSISTTKAPNRPMPSHFIEIAPGIDFAKNARNWLPR